MTPKENIKLAAIFPHRALFILVLVCLTSCDFVLKKHSDNDAINGTSQKIININKQEAKLLVKASQNNLDIIEVCQFLEKTELEKNIKTLTKDIENTHIEIFKNYKEVALENLISIPNYSNIESELINSNFELTEEKIIKNSLDLINQKISNQIKFLTNLSKTTNNIEFKQLSETTNPILKLKLDKTKNALTKL